MRSLLLALLTLGQLVAQNINPPDDPSLPHLQWTGSTTGITVQGNGSAAPVYGEYLSIYCAADTTVTTYWNSTAASATAGTWLVVPGATAAKPDIFTASNFSGGTTGFSFLIVAGSTLQLKIPNLSFPDKAASSKNFSFKTNSGSCTFNLQIRQKYR